MSLTPNSTSRLYRPIVMAATAAVVAAMLAFSQMAFAATLFTADFEDSSLSSWSKSGGTWAAATDGSQVARQSSASSENARIFTGATSWTSYAVQARVKPLTLATGGFAAVLARASGSTKFYRLALMPGNQVQLQAVSGSSVTVLGALSHPVSPGTWYTLMIDVNGTLVRGFVNGVQVASATSSLSATGRIGLQTSYATASFDDVVVSASGSAPPSASPSPSATPSASPSPSTSPPATGILYVATNGSDTNPGTLTQPLLTFQRAHDLVQAGGTIAVRGGTYAPSTTVKITKNGTPSQPITMTNYNAERVILDGENMPYTPGALGSSIPRPDRGALHVEGDWWRFTGLEIIHGPYGIFAVDSSNVVYDRIVTRDNYESGLQLQGASAGNQIINLDSYGNRDPRKNGESADGLAIKEGSGAGNVVRGARLWNNVDDGFDAWEFGSPILIENSASWGNGFNRWNFPDFQGDGNGWKMGGGDPMVTASHIISNTFAFDNAANGFIDNGNPGQHILDRNTAWRNAGTGFRFDRSSARLTSNLAVANNTPAILGSSTASANSWNIKSSWSASDLLSTDPSTLTGPRNTDGSIRTSNFLVPRDYPSLGAKI
jgi:hypothetical protein